MKICHFIASSKFGGAERVVVNLCNEMSKTHDVHLIAFDGEAHLHELASAVTLHRLKEFKRYNPFGMWQLLRVLRHIAPDIIHTHGAKATRIVYNIRRYLPAPFVATKHNARKGRIFNRIDHVIAVSRRVVESIAHRNVMLIYNGIDASPLPKRHTPHRPLRLLAVGRLDKIKGFDRLIDVCATLSFPFVLHIVGEGDERKELQQRIDRAGLQEHIRLSGFCHDIPRMMQEHDVVIISSHSEGFSLVMVEALFYANVLISTCVGGANEILQSEFVVTHETMAQRLEDIARRFERYVEAFETLAKQQRSRFLVETMCKRHIAYYRHVVETAKERI